MTEPLLEYVSTPARGRPAGYRLFPDGRVELCGGPGARDAGWRPTQTLTAEQVEAFVGVLDGTDLADLEARYEPPFPQRSVPSTAVWTLRPRGAVHRVEVVGKARVPVLEAIQQAFFEAQKVGVRAGAEVRVIHDGVEHAYALTCSPMECPGVDEVTKALLMPHNHAAAGEARPGAERLLVIVWTEGGVPQWEHVLTADGRLVRTLLPGGERKETWLSVEGMQRLAAALDRVDWESAQDHGRTGDS